MKKTYLLPVWRCCQSLLLLSVLWLPLSPALCVAAVSLSFWLISTGSVCQMRQERENLGWGDRQWMKLAGRGENPQGHHPCAPWREPGRFREHSGRGGLTQQFLQTAFWGFFPFYPLRNDVTLGTAFHFHACLR